MDNTPDNHHPRRREPAKQYVREAINRSSIVFVTVCTNSRKPILARPEARNLLVEAWTAADSWLVGRYVLMPDHLHLFAAPARHDSPNVRHWIKFWKSRVSRSWPWLEEKPVWQGLCWDTQLRTADSYAAKWEYVRANPVRAGLVSTPDDWEYGGELNVLNWFD